MGFELVSGWFRIWLGLRLPATQRVACIAFIGGAIVSLVLCISLG